MIGHKTIGKGFGGLARYVLNKPGTQRLPAGTLAGQTPVALAQEVAGLRAARRDLSKPVLHRTLSVTPEEHLTLEQWSWAAVHYMEQLGYGSVPWFAAIHEDAACQHLHICSLAIDPTRQDRFGRPARVSDSNDYARSARIIQGIEKKLGLCPGAMTPGEAAQLPWRQPSSPHVQRLARTGEAPEKARLQARIDAALQLAVDFEDFKAHLELAGVEVREYRKADHLSGLSFGLGGYWAKGSQLGKRYTAVSIMNEMEHRNEQRDDHGFKGGVAAPDPAGRGDQGHEPGRGSVGPVARDSGCSDTTSPADRTTPAEAMSPDDIQKALAQLAAQLTGIQKVLPRAKFWRGLLERLEDMQLMQEETRRNTLALVFVIILVALGTSLLTVFLTGQVTRSILLNLVSRLLDL